MKDLLIGMVVGVVTGYVLRKMEDDGKFRCLHANLHHLASKAKEEAMNLKDAGLDKIEYVADRVHQVAEQEKSKNKTVFMGRRQRRRAQILLIISKINLRPSVYSASSASSDIKLTHPLRIIVTDVFY